jgi:uncharacterized integral membrane protein
LKNLKVRRISEQRASNRRRIGIGGLILLLVVGIALIVFGLDLISHTESSIDPYYGQLLVPIGVVFTLFGVLGGIYLVVKSRRKE